MELVGDYGGYNAIANRQGALARRSNPAPTVQQRVQIPRASSRAPLVTNSSGRYSRPSAPPAVAPGPIDPNAFLGSDIGYQDQLRQFAKALTDFQADVTRRRGDVNTDYASSQKALGDQKVIDLRNLESDFGSRGLLHSGVYGNAVGDYNKEFNQRFSDLTSSRDKTLAQLLQEGNQFSTQQELQKQAAREAALRRRAETLGVVG